MDNIETIKSTLKKQGVLELVAYSRKSRDVDGEGLKKHHDIIKEFADKLGYPVKFYEEVGSSETLNRPMLNKLREDIKSKQVNCVVTYRLDRLSRKVTDTERLLKEFSFNDVILLEAHRESVVDYNETLGLKMSAMISDLYQEQAKQVLYAGRQKAVQLYGSHLGVAPLGYLYDSLTKKLVPNGDAWAVKKMFELALDGHCTHTIAIKMNELGVKTYSSRGNGTIIASTVHRILKNVKYRGCQVFGKEEFFKDAEGKTHTKKRPESEWKVYEQAHEAIVDPVMFEQVQQAMKDRQRTPHASRRRKFSLTQVVKCGKCGKSMSFIKAGTGGYTKDTIRTCFSADYNIGERCGNKGLPAHVVEDFIKEQIWLTVRPALLKAQREIVKGSKSQLSSTNKDSHDLKQLLGQKSKIEKQVNNTMDIMIDLGKSELLLAKLKQFEAQLEMIAKEIDKLELQDPNEVMTWVDRYLEQNEDLIGFPLNYKGKSYEEKNIFITKYVDWVEVLDSGVIGVKFQKDVERLISLV